jgi:hypothetical protein
LGGILARVLLNAGFLRGGLIGSVGDRNVELSVRGALVGALAAAATSGNREGEDGEKS